MRTALFTMAYFEGLDLSGSTRLDRNIRYIRHVREIKKELGFDDLWLVDNASDKRLYGPIPYQVLYDNSPALMNPEEINLYRFREYLPRRDDVPNGYQYGWRGVWFIRKLIEAGYDKIIGCESDCFILSKKLANYIRDSKEGFECFHSKKYNFPLAELFILNKDQFPMFMKYTETPWQDKVGLLMEVDLPFTKINDQFNFDRFGEYEPGGIPQTKEMDGYSQVQWKIPLEFNW